MAHPPFRRRLMRLHLSSAAVLLALVIAMIPSPGRAETVTINVDPWHSTGNCPLCGASDYECSQDGFGQWTDSPSFNDPTPAGAVVTGISITSYGRGCHGGTMGMTVQSTSIGSHTTSSTCHCGTDPCEVLQYDSQSYSMGFPGYNYGGVNTIKIATSAAVCLSSLTVSISYTSDSVAPTAFDLIAPANGARLTDEPISLQWAPSSDADSGVAGYDIYVGGLNVGHTTNTFFSLSLTDLGIAPCPSLSWYVVAVDNARNTQESNQTWNFVYQPEVAAPTIITPGSNSTVGCDVAVTWTYPTNATGIVFDVVKSDGTVLAEGLTGTSWSPSGNTLLPNGTYTIAVRARNCAGDVAPSGVRRFNVNNTPIAPVLQAPSEGQVTNGAPTLTWVVTGQQKAGVTYSVFIDDNANPAATVTSPLSWAVPAEAPLAEGSRHVEVVANGCASATASSGRRSFIVDRTGPEAFAITAPSTGTWFGADSSTIAVGWESAQDSPATVDGYEIRLDGTLVAATDAVTTQATVQPGASFGFEASTNGWTLTGSWGRTSTSAHTGSWSLTDSPGGNYGNDVTSYATLVAPVSPTTVSFWYHVDTEARFDQVNLQARTASSPNWQTLRMFDGSVVTWTNASVSLASFTEPVYLRFAFTSDYSVVRDGFYVDDIRIASAEEGEHELVVRARDTVGNTTDSAPITFGVDTTPPAPFALLGPADGLPTQSETPDLAWTESVDALSGTIAYRLYIDDALDSELGLVTTATPATPLTEGLRSWYVEAVDLAGNVRQSSETRSILVDQTPPDTVDLVDITPHGADDWVSFSVPTFVFTATDAGSGIDHYKLYIDGQPYGGPDIIEGAGNCFPDTCADAWNEIADGHHTWRVEAVDRVGLSTLSEVGSFIMETLPPLPFAQTSPANGVTVQTFSPLLCWETTTDAGSGLAGYTVSIQKSGGANQTVPVEPDPQAVELCVRPTTPLSNGAYTWLVTATDLAGNPTQANGGAASTMTVDQDDNPPTSTVTLPATDGGLSGCISPSFGGAARDPGVDATAPPGSGVVLVEVQVDGTSPTGWTPATLGGTPAIATRGWSWTWSAPTTGAHTLYVRATDAEGNTQTPPTTRTFLVDCTGPLAFALASPLERTYQASCPAFSWAATTDSPAGMGRYELRIQPASGDEHVIDAAGANSHTLAGDECLTQGTYTWYVKAYDTLANTTDSDSSRTFHVDTTGPVAFPILTQTPVSPTGWTCNGRSVTVTWSASADAGPGGGAGMAASPYQVYLNGAAWGGRTGATTATFTSLADGAYTWTVRAYDALDNWTDATVVAPLGAFSIDCTGPGVAETRSLRLFANHVPTYPSRHQSTPLDTGLDVVAGEHVLVTARGELCFTDDASCDPELRDYGFCMGPEGNDDVLGTFSKFYSAYAYGRVLAAIAGHEPTPIDVGLGATFTAPFTGRLLLSANDDDDYNCRSKWDEVTVQREAGFNLLFPVNGTVSDMVLPTFEWSDVTDAGIGVDRLEFVLNGAVVEGNLAPTATSFQLPQEAELTERDNTWQIRAYDALGNMSQSSVWTLRTDLTPPGIFDVATPEEGDVVDTKTPTMCWDATSDSRSAMAHYLVYVDEQYNTAQYPDQHCIEPRQPLAEGEHSFLVVAQDELRHERTSTHSRRFVVDTLPPDAFGLVAPLDGTTSYTALPELCWETTQDSGTGVQAYEVWLSGDRVATVLPPAMSQQPEVLCWQSIAPLRNGTFGWFVLAIDDAAHVTQADAWQITIQRDITPPVVTIIEPAAGEMYGRDGVAMRGTIVDPTPGTGAARVEIGAAGDPDSWTDAVLDDATGTWTLTRPVIADGDLTLCARGWDREGNPSPATGTGAYPCVQIRRDVSPPLAFNVLNPSDGTWVGARPTFSWQATTDAPAGVSHYYLQIAGRDEIDAGTQTSFELTLEQALPDGPGSWTARAVDALGNSRAASGSATFRVDGLAPNQVVLASPETGSWSSSARPELCWSATTDNGASGVASYRVRIDGAPHTVVAPATCYTPAANLSQDSHSWDAAAIDNAGNVGAVSASRTVRLDLTAPPAPTATYPDDRAQVKANPPSFSWLDVTDGPAAGASGVCRYVVTVNGVEHEAGSTANHFTWPTTLTDGVSSWSVRAEDCAGNVGAGSQPRTLHLDTVAPASVAFTAPTPDAWLATKRPTLSWALGTDSGTGICSYEVTIDSGAATSVSASTSTLVVAADLIDGVHTASVRAIDCAGNASEASGVTFHVDTTAPVMGALVAPRDAACVGTSSPELSWSACSDAGVGVSAQSVWIDDVEVAVGLGPEVTSFQATGLTTGAHGWFVKCADALGHGSDSNRLTFTVDLEAPSIGDVAVALAPDGLTVTASATDNGLCDVSEFEVQLDDEGWASAQHDPADGAWALTIDAPAAGGHQLSVRATDSAGNVSERVSYALNVGPCWVLGACDADTAACSTPAVEGLTCDDHDACTTVDACDGAGECVGDVPLACDDHNDCTDDHCDATLGCGWTNNVAACDDGDACTTDDTCAAGVCVGGAARSCDDSDPCTTDSCDPATGCVVVDNTDACDDGDACTVGDTCAAGTCTSGVARECGDGNPCTADSCDPATGCVYANLTSACDDGDACTTDDTCAAGVCVGGAARSCDDSDPCTTDSCDPATGCVVVDNTDACDDGDACTVGDTCAAGACVSGVARACDDDNACTADSCDPATGCVHANLTSACDDGDACTTDDTCGAGTCAGTPRDCDDGDVCTTDSCGDGSCAHEPVAACCNTAGECGTGEACVGHACASTVCAICTGDADCGFGGVCAALPSGDHCVVPCAEGTTPCADGYTCETVTDVADSALCLPDQGDCECVAAFSRQCTDSAVVEVDSCGAVGDTVETCTNGCIEAANGAECCPDGTHPSGGECTAVSVADGDPDADVGDGHPDTVETPDVIDSMGGPDSGGADTTTSETGGSKGGCAAGSQSTPLSALVMLLMWALTRVWTRRRPVAVRQHTQQESQ